MLGQVLLDQIMYCDIEIVCLLQNICCLTESFRNDSIQSGVGTCDGGGGGGTTAPVFVKKETGLCKRH